MIPLFLVLLATSPPEAATLTWYEHGTRTFCGQEFSPHAPHVAHVSLPCGVKVRLCVAGRCGVYKITDRMPQSSADRYEGAVFDVTPAIMNTLDIPFGRTAEGLAWGRAAAIWTELKQERGYIAE